MIHFLRAGLLSLPLLVNAADAPAVITVDAANSPGRVNPLIFGQNVVAADDTGLWTHDSHDLSGIETGMGYWDPAKKAPVPAIVEATRNAGAAMLRYPGGANAHVFEWHKAVGPVETRGNWTFGIPKSSPCAGPSARSPCSR